MSQGQLLEAVAPAHDVSTETLDLGGDECFRLVCSCGWESAPHLIAYNPDLLAKHHPEERSS